MRQYFFLVEAERACEVTSSGLQDNLCDEVSHSRSQLTVQIPSVDAAARQIPCSRHNITPGLFLLLDELRDEFWVMREISVHEDDIVASAGREPFNVS